MFSRFASFLIRHPIPVLMGLAIVTVAASVLATQVRFDFTPQLLLGEQDELALRTEEFKEAFGHEDAVVIVVLEATGDEDVLDHRALTWQAAIADDLAGLPRVERVESLATMKRLLRTLSWPPTISYVPLIEELPVDRATEDRMRRAVERSKLLEGSLLSADRRLSALLVFFDSQESQEIAAMRGMVASVSAALEQHPLPEGYQLHLSGLPALRVDIVKNLQEDQTLLIPIAGILYLAALGFVFRRLSGSLVPLLAVGIGLACTLAVLAVSDQPFNIVSNILPMLLLILGVSNCVHIISRYAEEGAEVEHDRKEATRRTISHMGTACLLTFLTTATGFLSLWIARSEALREFATQSAMGLGFLYLSIMVTLGTLLPFFRPPRRGGSRGRTSLSLTRMIVAAGDTVALHPRLTLLLSGLVVAGALWSARGVVVDSYTLETYDDDHPTLRTMRLVENRLSGLLPLEINLEAADSHRFLDPEIYRKVAEVQQFAAEREAVLSTRSYVDLHREVDANFQREDEPGDHLPPLGEEGRRHIERTAGIIERFADEFRPEAFLTPDGRKARILLRVRDVGTRQMLALIDETQAKLDQEFPPATGIQAQFTGDVYANARATDNIIRDLFYSLIVASLVICAIIAILFQSIRAALVTALPNLTPLILTLGYMGIRGFDMNVGNVIVFTISLGIAVDNTIHFLYRFRAEADAHGDVVRGVDRALRGTGRAVVLTSVLIVSGLAVLLLSDFVPTRRFAELTMVTMGGALIADLLLLPACLVLFWKKRPESPSRVSTPQHDSPQSELEWAEIDEPWAASGHRQEAANSEKESDLLIPCPPSQGKS